VDNHDVSFWEKPLAELTPQEWESLCDHCGRCCLHKLTDDDTGTTHYTRVVCRYYDEPEQRCSEYLQRQQLVPDCIDVADAGAREYGWMPSTCAYRLRYEDKPLYDWHPLNAGNRKLMERQGIPISGRVLSELHVHEAGLEEHVIRWVKAGGT